MVNQELVRRKLSKLIQYLEELESIKNYTFQEYLDNHFIRRTAERLLQLIVEVATDINGHIIVEKGHLPPKNYYESFIFLGDLGVLNKSFARQLAPSSGLRNRLVHEYEEIDDKIVYDSIDTALKNYKKYVKEIDQYLDESP